MKSLATVLLVLTILRSSSAFQVGNYEAIIDATEKESVFKPQEYLLQEASLLPDVPGVPKIPGGLEIPKIPGVPELPKLPELPKVPEIPKIPGTPEIPKIPGAPELPKVPEIPKIPGVPEIPKIPGVPGLTDLIPRRICLVVKCFPRWSKFQICRCVKSRAL